MINPIILRTLLNMSTLHPSLLESFQSFDFKNLSKDSETVFNNNDRAIKSALSFSDRDLATPLFQKTLHHYTNKDVIFLSTELSITERDLLRLSGFDFKLVDDIVDYFKESYNTYNLFFDRDFIVKGLFKRSYDEFTYFPKIVDAYSFGTNYYTHEIFFGLFANNNAIFYQFFFEGINDKLVPKVKICFPMNESDYFTVIVSNDDDFKLAKEIIYSQLIVQLRMILQYKYPSECHDLSDCDDSVIIDYFTIIRMDEI